MIDYLKIGKTYLGEKRKEEAAIPLDIFEHCKTLYIILLKVVE